MDPRGKIYAESRFGRSEFPELPLSSWVLGNGEEKGRDLENGFSSSGTFPMQVSRPEFYDLNIPLSQ